MAVSRPKGFLGLAALGVLSFTSQARAQDHTGDPYKAYNGAYESFVYPSFPNGYGYVPNQGILNGRSSVGRTNRFQEFLDDLDSPFGSDNRVDAPRRSGPGVPYYQAFRRYDQDYDRIYRPNANADTSYYEGQRELNKKYVAYLRERDPKRRARLLQEYNQERLRSTRELEVVRPGAGRAPRDLEMVRPGAGLGTAAAATSRRAATTAPAGATSRSGSARGTAPSSLLSPRRPGAPSASAGASPSETLRRAESFGGRRSTPSTIPRSPASASPR